MSQPKPKTLEIWYEVVASGNHQRLDEILSEDIVFYSPVVWTPQKGKFLTKMYLLAASQVIGGSHFKYTHEIISENSFMLEFTTEIEGIIINGVDIIKLDNEQKIKEFKVMIRPLKAIHKIHEKMGEVLEILTK